MPEIQLDSPIITGHGLRAALARADCGAAARSALTTAAEAVSDIGVTDLTAGRLEAAVGRFQQGLRLDPACRSAFHNLVFALQNAGQLRGANFDAVRSHLIAHWHQLPWRDAYRHLLTLPRFLNVEFVKGKCNLKCRMCIGTNSAAHPDRLTAITVEDFEGMLTAAPTIAGVTLSSGDSDPLLHPQFVEILETAARRGVPVDLYTNGLPLSARSARAVVSLGVVSIINFSIDAATSATYSAIRGGDFEKLLSKVRMLTEMKRSAGVGRPLVSFSFVAMRDNILELPAFVQLAAHAGAEQVIVDDLSGWIENAGGNHPATDRPDCAALLRSATRMAARHEIRLTLHERLRRLVEVEPKTGTGLQCGAAGDSGGAGSRAGTIAAHLHDVSADLGGRADASRSGLACCGWIDGVWVGTDGRLHPCCMVQGVADMGRVQDGSIQDNSKYRQVKDALLAGRVFAACASQRMCAYVQQQKARGVALQFIDETGAVADKRPTVEIGAPKPHETESGMRLPVLR